MKRLVATLVITATCMSASSPADAGGCHRSRGGGYRHYSQPQHHEEYHQHVTPSPYIVTPGTPYGPYPGQPYPMTGQPFVDPAIGGQPFTTPTFEGQPGAPAGGQPFTGGPTGGQPFTGVPGQGAPTGSGLPVTGATVVPPTGPQGEVSLPGTGVPQDQVSLPGGPQGGEVSLPGPSVPDVSLPGPALPEATVSLPPVVGATVVPPTVETSTTIVEPVAPVVEVTRHEVFMSLPLQLTAPGSTDLPGSAVLRFPGFEMPLTVNLWQEGLIEVQMPTMTFAGNMEATLLLYRADRTLYAELPLMLINAAQ